MLLPIDAPTKLPPSGDHDPKRYKDLAYSKGLWADWEQSAECPCTQSLDSAGLTQFTTSGQTHEARPDCELCEGRGYFWHSKQRVRCAVTGFRDNPQLFSMLGEWGRGAVSFSFMPEQLPAVRDRLTLVNSVMVHRETRTRTAATVERLRYPVVERELDLSGGVTTVGVLYMLKAGADGTATAAGALTPGVDFEVNANGEIDWTLGDGLGTAPAAGIRYSVTYYAHPRYVIEDSPHSVRDTWIKAKKVSREFTPLPVNAFARREMIGDQGDRA